jgi:hypothetical protein
MYAYYPSDGGIKPWMWSEGRPDFGPGNGWGHVKYHKLCRLCSRSRMCADAEGAWQGMLQYVFCNTNHWQKGNANTVPHTKLHKKQMRQSSKCWARLWTCAVGIIPLRTNGTPESNLSCFLYLLVMLGPSMSEPVCSNLARNITWRSRGRRSIQEKWPLTLWHRLHIKSVSEKQSLSYKACPGSTYQAGVHTGRVVLSGGSWGWPRLEPWENWKCIQFREPCVKVNWLLQGWPRWGKVGFEPTHLIRLAQLWGNLPMLIRLAGQGEVFVAFTFLELSLLFLLGFCLSVIWIKRYWPSAVNASSCDLSSEACCVIDGRL